MGSFLSSLFVDPTALPANGYGVAQLFFLAGTYGYILFVASGMIASGSELLTLVLDPGFVGGFLLPVLGAVPDGAIVLFSGLGPNAQEQLAVGVGTLAGSSILLLTLPWAACIVLGRVDLGADGAARYGARPKLTPPGSCSLTRTGVTTSADISWGAVIMLGTAVSYLVVQLPAWAGGSERAASLAGLLCAAALFVLYSVYQIFSARSHELQAALQATLRKDALTARLLQLTTVIMLELESEARKAAGAGGAGAGSAGGGGGGGVGLLGSSAGSDALLLGSSPAHGSAAALRRKASVSAVAMRRIFDEYDADKNGVLTKPEVRAMFKEVGIKVTAAEFELALRDLAGPDGVLSFDEFTSALRVMMELQAEAADGSGSAAVGLASPAGSARRGSGAKASGRNARGVVQLSPVEEEGGAADDGGPRTPSSPTGLTRALGAQAVTGVVGGGSSCGDEDEEGGGGGGGGEGGLEDDDEEVDAETAKLTPAQIKVKAFARLAVALLLVTLFSDPMCDVISEMGARLQRATGLANAAFYIAFIFTPLISNATEMISSVIFASRKTQKSIVITYAQLLGAAAMNNTFCLAIFLALVYAQGLRWNYGAEVLAVLLVEAVMCVVAYQQKTPLWHAAIPLALYPISLATVYLLERGGMN